MPCQLTGLEYGLIPTDIISRVWHLLFRLGARNGLLIEMSGQKQDFWLLYMYTISGPLPEKARGPQQNLGAYAPGPLGKSNPD